MYITVSTRAIVAIPKPNRMLRRILTIFLLAAATVTQSPSSQAASNEPSVEGSFDISLEGQPTRHVEFNARTAANGTTTGEVTFRDAGAAKAAEADGDTVEAFYVKARVDCLVVKGNKAILTGTVIDASLDRYINGRLVLVALSNEKEPDSQSPGKITWGLYRKTNRDWTASDFDRAADEVNPAAWMASDYERDDDEAKVATSSSDASVGCNSFPLSAFTFKEDYYVNGTVRVRP